MAKVFVDTAAWIALVNTTDALYADARRVMDRLRLTRAGLVTTEFVLLELADALSDPSMRMRTVSFVDSPRHLTALEIVSVSQELIVVGWDLYRKRSDKGWGLSDCTSFVVMRQHGITEVFTSDHHFAQAGFTKLL